MSTGLVDSTTAHLLQSDQQRLAATRFPIVTVSGSFRDKLEALNDLADAVDHPDIVFSRAHYSMALGVAIAAWGGAKVDATKAWGVDPTNYIQSSDWSKLSGSELLGRTFARHSLLAWLKKHVLDQNVRKKLPFTDAITGPLLFLCEHIERPIISLHYEAGNILAPAGHTILQVVTDPHVQASYLKYAELDNMTFAVFDEQTRHEFFELAEVMEKAVDPRRVVVTGPPIDPRVAAARTKKSATSWQRRPLRILLTTGGLGTNKAELAAILKQLLPLTRSRAQAVQLLYFAGTNQDHVKMVKQLARRARVKIGGAHEAGAKLRVFSGGDVVEANDLLIRLGFPWADLIITKPSGDMAYDAIASGAALLFLKPWGKWEEAILARLTTMGVARVAQTQSIVAQLASLRTPHGEKSWLEQALWTAQHLPPRYTRGAYNILALARKLL